MKTQIFCRKFWFALFVLMQINAFAQKVILEGKEQEINLSPDIGILKDADGKLSFQQAQRQKYEATNVKNVLFIPYSSATFWLKITVKNKDWKHDKLLFQVFNNFIERVAVYIPNEQGKFTITHLGTLTNNNFRTFENTPIVPFQLKKGVAKTIFVRIRSDRGVATSIRILPVQVYEKGYMKDVFVVAFVLGLVFLRLIYILYISFFAIKDRTFRKYSILQIFRSIAVLGLNGAVGLLIFKDNLVWANTINYISQSILPIFLIIMLKEILPIKNFHKSVNYYLNFTFYSNIIINILIVIDYRWIWMLMGVWQFISLQMLIVGMFVFSYYKKWKFSINYAVPFLLILISYMLVQFRMVGLIDSMSVTFIAYLFFIGEIFVFGYFLGRIIIQYEKSQTESAQALVLNKEKTKQLQELDRIKTNFFTNVSHEIRTPLTLILSPLQELMKEFPQRDIFKMMNRNGEKLLNLINQLLDLSKLEGKKMTVENQEVELVSYFRTLCASFHSFAEAKKCKLIIEQNKTEYWANTDKDKLDKIFTNLVSNALKFTEENKKISIKILFVEQTVKLYFEDQGIGISEAKLPYIFDRFYQVEDEKTRHFEGTGIGLSLVKELVAVLGGEISVESVVDKGTIFMVNLPINEIEQPNQIAEKKWLEVYSEEAIYSSHNTKQTNQNKQIILIVDDNQDIRTYIKSIFKDDFQIIEAINGNDALRKTKEVIPDIIISDLMMPEMDGMEFCKHIKADEKTSHIPIVMLTAKADTESKMEGLEMGADDYLLKPFHTEEIKIRIKNLLQKQVRLQAYFSEKVIKTDLKPSDKLTVEEQFLLKLKTILEKNSSNSQFGVEQFSKEVGISQSQLLRKIKALSNKTIVEFIREYRLQKAADLIQKNAGAISEIAFQTGFESLSYFTKSFQEKFGKSPSEWR